MRGWPYFEQLSASSKVSVLAFRNFKNRSDSVEMASKMHSVPRNCGSGLSDCEIGAGKGPIRDVQRNVRGHCRGLCRGMER